MQSKIKIILTLFILNCSIQASQVVWDGKNNGISQKEYDKAIK
ncbi:MAG: hypothetical protein U9N59_06215 [Campylobacterota bacterium]|nr:hypothetical protein [Campylobacterota bacterium]